MIYYELGKDGDMVNSYIHADGQILAKCDHTGASIEDYFYITDRQGSVRVIADDGGAAQVSYTYDPFGVVIEENGTFANPFKFTGQWYDEEISQYYLRARMYDPRLMRFTGYDSIRGKYEEPMSLHRFLYCENEPISRIDPWGLLYAPPALKNDIYQTEIVTEAVIKFVKERGFLNGPMEAFSRRGYEFDYKYTKYTFKVSDEYVMKGSEYGNWVTAYTCTYLFGQAGNWGARIGGHFHALTDKDSDGHFDEPASRYFISGGVLMGDARRLREGMPTSLSQFDYIIAKGRDLKYGMERITENNPTSLRFDQELDLYITFWNSR